MQRSIMRAPRAPQSLHPTVANHRDRRTSHRNALANMCTLAQVRSATDHSNVAIESRFDKHDLNYLAIAGLSVITTQFVEPGNAFAPPSMSFVVKPA